MEYPEFDKSKHVELHIGGVATGKTYSISSRIVKESLKGENRCFLVIRKDYRNIKHSVFASIVNALKRSYGYNIKESSMTIDFCNGNKILFCDVLSAQSYILDYKPEIVWLDDAHEEEDISVIASIIFDTRKQQDEKWKVIFSLNPISSKHWSYFVCSGLKLNDSQEIVRTKQENCWIADENVEFILNTVKQPEYSWMITGEFPA